MQAEKGRKTIQKNGPAMKQKTGVKTSTLGPNRLALNEVVSLDSSSRIKSTSKSNLEQPLGDFEDKQVPGSCQKSDKKVQRLKFIRPISYHCDSPISEANGFDSGRYL
eukprot:Gb_40914 [translate_table: standard]